MISFNRLNWVICTLFCTFASAHAQTVTISLNPPAQRDEVILNGTNFLAARLLPIVSDLNAPDPFIGRVEKTENATLPSGDVVVKTLENEADLLKAIANRISARGTAILGNDRFLLLGQKRLKVGESIIINFDGQDYEVSLVEITNTTFTIKRDELSYTRAVLLSR